MNENEGTSGFGLSQLRDAGPRSGVQFRSRWRSDAACLEHQEMRWFESEEAGRLSHREVMATKLVCASCSVQRECLDTAMADDSLIGIWGGTTTRHRQRLRMAEASDRSPELNIVRQNDSATEC